MSAIVKVGDIHKSFGSNHVLKGVSFEVNKGEMIAVIGASGSGKSTALRCIDRLETIDGGEITVCDHKVSDPEIDLRRLRLVGLTDKLLAYPEQLSGGQQQRVAIARSLALQPQVMLFDEVTSALDPELTAEVLAVIEDLARRGMTMITVTHEMGFARRVASLLVFMHQGKVWETGPTAAVFANPQTAEFKQFVGSEL